MVASRTYTFRVVLTLWVLTWSNYLRLFTVVAAAAGGTASLIATARRTTIVNETTTVRSGGSAFANYTITNWIPSSKTVVTVKSPPPQSSPNTRRGPTVTTGTTASLVDNNCLGQMECDALDEFEPPPDLVPFLPPPPLPASLLKSLTLPYVGDKLQTDDISPSMAGVEVGGGHSSAFLIAHRDICNLCVWANRDNNTETVTIPALGITQETTWISILVVASLASAVVGAIFMIMFLKCRKFKILPMTDSCPILPDSYFGNKTNNNNHQSNSSGCVNGSENRVDPAGEALNNGPKIKAEAHSRNAGGGGGGTNGGNTTSHSTSIWNFWRRTSSSTERPLRSPGSLCSEENSYSEEPYVVSEHSSALYAELNSVNQDGNGAYRTYSMNTYSEVCDPNINKKMSGVLCSPGGGNNGGNNPCHHLHHHHHHHHHRHLLNDGTYENAAYVLSENTVECHHGCPVHSNSQQLMLQETDSLDTPSSSAYYSDSSNQNQANARKRKKKQLRPMAANDDVNMNDEDVITETISGNVHVANYYPSAGANFNLGGGQMVRYPHEPFNSNSLRVVVQQQPIRIHDSVVIIAAPGGKRPLPLAPPPPPPMPTHLPPIQTSTPIGTPINSGQQSPTFLSSSNRSSIRPLPPVPSQYV